MNADKVFDQDAPIVQMPEKSQFDIEADRALALVQADAALRDTELIEQGLTNERRLPLVRAALDIEPEDNKPERMFFGDVPARKLGKAALWVVGILAAAGAVGYGFLNSADAQATKNQEINDQYQQNYDDMTEGLLPGEVIVPNPSDVEP